jgi:hypothetical protein
MQDVKENIRNMSDKELVKAYKVGQDMLKNPKFDRLDKEILLAIEWEHMMRLADGDYIEF